MFVEINPHSLKQDYAKKDGVPGVYVWGYVETDGTFIPLYAGKSRNVFERLIQHYCRFKAGECSIFKRQDLIDSYCKSCRKIPKRIYEPTNFKDVFNLSRNADHSYMIDNYIFRYAEILEEEIRKQAECFLADAVDRNYLITSVNKGNTGSLSRKLKSLLESMIH